MVALKGALIFISLILSFFRFIFGSGGVAGGTIFKFGDAFVQVDFGRFTPFVGVAVVAGLVGIGRCVAGLAGNLAFTAVVEGEGVPGQFGRGPGRCRMTADTVGAEKTNMNLRFFMTACAFGRGSGQNLIGVAVNTINLSVAAIEDKVVGMVEGVHQGITAVMTGETILTQQGGMVGGERRLACRVAVKTIDQLGRELLFQMTVETFDFRFIKVFFMSGQTEIGQAVVLEVCQGQQGDVGVPAFVFGVAVFTAGGIVQTAVQSQAALPLFGNRLVARFAPFGRNALPGGMTKAAIPLKFRMIVETP
jgi:hypothetical protein